MRTWVLVAAIWVPIAYYGCAREDCEDGEEGCAAGGDSDGDGDGDGDGDSDGDPWGECQSVAERVGADLESCVIDGDPEPPVDRYALSAAGSCDDLVETFRDRLLEDMRRSVNENYCRALRRQCCPPSADADADIDADADGDGDGDGDGDADEYSTTNTQEDGVDEADFIKNDGNYIYILAGGRFLILDAWPAAEMSELSSTPVEGTPQKLYVAGDTAVIYSYDPLGQCYDTYNYQFGGSCLTSASTTIITVLDITDRAAPVRVRRVELSGVYVDSRRIATAVHTVIASPGFRVDGVTYSPWEDFCSYTSEEDLRAEFDALIVQNERLIRETPVDLFLPSIIDTRYLPDGSEETERDHFGDCRDVMIPSRIAGTSFLTVFSFELEDPGPPKVTSVVGEQGVVYSSSDALYVASIENPGAGEGREYTTVHRFPYSEGDAAVYYQGSGRVSGRVLNQFSLGEHEGYLRMATTTGHVPSTDVFNSVFVLHPSGEGLDVVGTVSPIGATEDVRSARFVGDRGFVVTFKKTDPLFVIDLSDPENPLVAGELHIPGFSTYMHMMDEDHILSIGFDAEDHGSFAYFQGVLLQVFDVSDMTNPTLVHRHVIGTRGTTTEATSNHLAFNFFRPRDALAIPMAICEESGGGGSYGDEMTFNGLMVFDVTLDDGIGEHGRISHGIPGDPISACSNWWTDPSSWVQRSIFMEDYVYSVAPDRIIVAHLDDLSTPVASLDLPYEPVDDGWDDW